MLKFRQMCNLMKLQKSITSTTWKCSKYYCGSSTKGGCGCNISYLDRKYGDELPCDNVKPPFEVLPNIPSGIFRNTEGEKLGLEEAGKDKCYKNPEYFSFHHMTFYDMHVQLRKYRNPSPKTGRKP